MLDIAGAVPSKDKIQPANQLEKGGSRSQAPQCL
ncbi:hypothetical protein SLEP1_g4061 [Rubroshorea leprosula]|uniref:Uncharacterized protein n=1 Tax=Rubroshorea leprosula TaxID=152421 RepID=A0AAV5HTH2_9ROSI|nr:hypothetical protein SLEP1_g4061 [Rubroshorea leprosula]